MRHIVAIILFTVILSPAKAQEEPVKAILDSILNEAGLMYAYEKAVWHSTDLLMTDRKIKEVYGGYVVRHSADSVFVSYVSKNKVDCIAYYVFTMADLVNPCIVSKDVKPLQETEKGLFDIKQKMISQMLDSKYNISIPDGFSPNFVFFKEDSIFKLYMIMGTSESGVIPFGNDYVFWGDAEGNITDWKKFHSRMVPAYSKGPHDEQVRSVIHSHLKTTPYITATDICTFRLYGELCGLDEFSVYCTATGKYYKYLLKTNTIEVNDD